jgi:hypothetical protein
MHRKGFIIAGEEIMKMQLEIERLMGEVENWKLWAKSQPSYQDQESRFPVFRPKLKRQRLVLRTKTGAGND